LTDLRDRLNEDDREFFVVAWCRHPSYIEPEKVIFIPEPLVPGVEENMRRGLHYLVRIRLVALQNVVALPGPPGDGGDEDDGGDGPVDRDERDDRGRDGDDCWSSPRRDSDGESFATDPWHRNDHPTCSYPPGGSSGSNGVGARDSLVCAQEVGHEIMVGDRLPPHACPRGG
jgi:hypothetical protein